MLKVFISHSWEDNEISKELAEKLRQDGADVWIDYAKISGGDNFLSEMGRAIDWCDALVLIWSKTAANSKYVEMEWTSAATNDKKIIPCMIDDTRLPTILSGLLY